MYVGYPGTRVTNNQTRGVTMGKQTVHITVDPAEWERYKAEVSNASEDIRGYISTRVNGNRTGTSERIKELESSLQEKREKKEELEEEMAKLQRELSALQSKQMAEEKIEESREEVLQRFRDIAETHVSEGNWTEPEDIKPYWPQETGMSREELWEEVKEE